MSHIPLWHGHGVVGVERRGCWWVRRWNGVRFLPPFSASTWPAVKEVALALPPAAAVCASAVKEVALDVRVLPEAPHKGVFNISSLSTREESDGSSNTPRSKMVLRSEFVTRGPFNLAIQPNNRKNVAHIISPRETHTIRPCHWFSITSAWTPSTKWQRKEREKRTQIVWTLLAWNRTGCCFVFCISTEHLRQQLQSSTTIHW